MTDSVCLVTGKPLRPFFSFGRMPIANGFLTPDQFKEEYFFELAVGFNPESRMVQLIHRVEEKKMFHENYAFFSSTSAFMERHFARFSDFILENYLKDCRDPLVVEIGSNDGILLKNFSQKKIRHLGIEPSANVAEKARERGVRTRSEFFNEALAEKILAESGPADAFLGANVMCHIPYIHSVFEGVRRLLAPRGVFVFEDPYLGDILQKVSYDQIYDEHVFYFSVASIDYLAARHGLELIDVLPQDVHGGSMRYVLSPHGSRPVSASVARQKEIEKETGLDDPAVYRKLGENIEKSKSVLMNLLGDLRRQGKRIAGYGATSKSATVTNFCGITPDRVEYICDTTPIKQGKYSPGAHIPVRPYEAFAENYPDYALLFAWNHAAEIMAKEKKFTERGGRFILYVPEVKVAG